MAPKLAPALVVTRDSRKTTPREPFLEVCLLRRKAISRLLLLGAVKWRIAWMLTARAGGISAPIPHSLNFPFDPPPESFEQVPTESRREVLAPPEPAPAIQSWRFRPVCLDRMEIDVAQPAIDFEAAVQSSKVSGLTAIPHEALTLVAPLEDRRLAGFMDAALLFFAYGGFLALFAVLGGRFTVSKFGAIVTAATLALFYAQYFVLFTFFGGRTPGMMFCRLRVVSYDGAEPSPRQLLWRSFGYLVSAATVMLGFVWALWDEDNLSWHDRISQTYLTLDHFESGNDPGEPPDPLRRVVLARHSSSRQIAVR